MDTQSMPQQSSSLLFDDILQISSEELSLQHHHQNHNHSHQSEDTQTGHAHYPPLDQCCPQYPSWSLKSPELWSPDEFAGWLIYWAHLNQVPDSELIYLLYEPLSGFELCSLGHQFFADLCPQYGLLIFEALHQMVTVWQQQQHQHQQGQHQSGLHHFLCQERLRQQMIINGQQIGQSSSSSSAAVTSSASSQQQQTTTASTTTTSVTSGGQYRTLIIYDIENTPPPLIGPSLQTTADQSEASIMSTTGSGSRAARVTAAVSRGEERPKTGKLWQFLIQLLSNPKTNPSLIQWINEEDGRFKFIQCDKVAKLWGRRNYNNSMTYDKMSRAIRYYYKQEVLLPVPGQTHVYRFGPNAKLWLNKYNYFRP